MGAQPHHGPLEKPGIYSSSRLHVGSAIVRFLGINPLSSHVDIGRMGWILTPHVYIHTSLSIGGDGP